MYTSFCFIFMINSLCNHCSIFRSDDHECIFSRQLILKYERKNAFHSPSTIQFAKHHSLVY